MLYSLLAAETNTAISETQGIFSQAWKTFKGIVDIALPVIIAVLLTLGIILGVKVGIKFAKAEDEEGKKKAKEQLVNIIVGFVVAILITAVIYAVLSSGAVKSLFSFEQNVTSDPVSA